MHFATYIKYIRSLNVIPLLESLLYSDKIIIPVTSGGLQFGQSHALGSQQVQQDEDIDPVQVIARHSAAPVGLLLQVCGQSPGTVDGVSGGPADEGLLPVQEEELQCELLVRGLLSPQLLPQCGGEVEHHGAGDGTVSGGHEPWWLYLGVVVTSYHHPVKTTITSQTVNTRSKFTFSGLWG